MSPSPSVSRLSDALRATGAPGERYSTRRVELPGGERCEKKSQVHIKNMHLCFPDRASITPPYWLASCPMGGMSQGGAITGDRTLRAPCAPPGVYRRSDGRSPFLYSSNAEMGGMEARIVRFLRKY